MTGHLSGHDDISLGDGPSPDRAATPSVDKSALRARQLGIDARLGRRAPCVLPGHAGDHVARTHPTGKGPWNLYCPACDASFSFAAIRAIVAYAKIAFAEPKREEALAGAWRSIRPPGPTEISRWSERLDHEAGLLNEEPVAIIIPPDLSPNGRRVANGIRLLLALRHPMWGADEPFTFARRFARAWCDVGDTAARGGVAELRERRVIVPVGKAGIAITYRLGRADEIDAADGSTWSPSTFIDALIAQLDAVELPAQRRPQ